MTRYDYMQYQRVITHVVEELLVGEPLPYSLFPLPKAVDGPQATQEDVNRIAAEICKEHELS